MIIIATSVAIPANATSHEFQLRIAALYQKTSAGTPNTAINIVIEAGLERPNAGQRVAPTLLWRRNHCSLRPVLGMTDSSSVSGRKLPRGISN